VQDNIADPDPVTLAGVTEHEVLTTDKPTGLAKPFREATEIVDAPADPALTVTEAGLAVNAKSST